MISRFGDVGIDNRIPLSDASGAVDAVGNGATRFRLGDRVATIFFPDWISGRFRSSYASSAFGGEGADGVLSEYVIVPERALVASPALLPDDWHLPLSRLNANIVGIQTGSRQYFEDMNRFIEEHGITPVVDREFTFDEALQAFAYMAEQRHFGKVVISVAAG